MMLLITHPTRSMWLTAPRVLRFLFPIFFRGNTHIKHHPGNQYSWVCLPVQNPGTSPKEGNFVPAVAPIKATQEQRLAGFRHGTLYPYLRGTTVCNCLRDTRVRKADGGYLSDLFPEWKRYSIGSMDMTLTN